MNRFNFRFLGQAVVLICFLGGCVTHESRPLPQIVAKPATAQIPESQLLDVGVQLFDPNIPEDEKEREKAGISADVRKAEARFMPNKLRETLESTGQWGQVRVVPPESDAMDVRIAGKILKSTGSVLYLDITVTDATGRQWLAKTYQSVADVRSYKDGNMTPRDPFQNVYSAIANDILAAREKMAAAELESIHRVAELRFASSLAPYAFKDYLSSDKQGQYRVLRLPAQEDPLYERMGRLRERDYALVDTLNEHYSVFAGNMAESYNSWRKYSYNEIEAQDEAKRTALSRKLLGAAAIIGGVLAASKSNTYAGDIVGTAAVIGGVYAVKSGFDKGAEVKMHADSLKQLTDSFQSEVKPMVVDVEGRTLQLKGSAEEQYHEWRQLLKEYYENETGLAVQETPTSSAAAAKRAATKSSPNATRH
jgi:hypothetical protein